MRHLALPLFVLLLGAGCPGQLDTGCVSDADCSGGATCLDGECVQPDPADCVIDTDCPGGQVCNMGACITSLPTDGEGTVSLDPADGLDFGAPALGVGLDATVAVHNAGPGPITLTAAALSSTTSDEFVLTLPGTLPMAIPAGESRSLIVTYTLADGEADQGTLEFATDATACGAGCTNPAAIEVPLTSDFSGTRVLDVTPSTYDFGYAAPGSTSAPTTLFISNTGTLDKILTVENITPAGDTDQFEYAVPDLPLFLAPGESATVPVSYAPTAVAATHTLTFAVGANSDTPGSTSLGAVFTGRSEATNALAWTPPSLTFPELNVGQGAQLSAQLVNTGTVAVTVQDLVLGAQSPVEYSFTALSGGVQVSFPRLLLGGDALDVIVDYSALSGQASQTTLTALNDQASGVTPTLTLQGESYAPVGGTVLDVVVAPQDTLPPSCLCAASLDIPAANVDIQYKNTATGQSCTKPPSLYCGTNGVPCDCAALDAYGDVSWYAERFENVRGDDWVVNEAVHHEGAGQDGTFEISATLLDDCIAIPGSTDYSTNQACCLVDCGEFGYDDGAGTQSCYNFPPSPICSTTCQYLASGATSQDCLQRGPNRVKALVTIKNADGSVEEQRAFCRTLQQSGDSSAFVSVTRASGVFSFGAVTPGVTEIDPAGACP